MDATVVVAVLLTINAVFEDVVDAAASYRYLGCFKDVDGIERDLKGRDLILSGLTPEICAGQCQPSGYPYIGLQFGRRCFCGDNFGNHGASVDCNTTCEFQYCGGYLSNDVYYSPDRSKAGQRRHVFHSSALTFSEARMKCVSGDGDLPSIDNNADLDAVITNVTASANGTGVTAVWIGLRQRQATGPLEWANENTIPYNLHYYDFDQYWEASETFSNPCVQMTVATKKWQTVSCDIALPFVCLQVPPAPEATQPSFTAAEPIAEEEDSTMNLALVIVLPIFMFCYGGSCIAYMVYKIYRNCYRIGHKPHDNLDGADVSAHAPRAFPAYLHAPGQPLPPPVRPEAIAVGPNGFAKSPPKYENQAPVAISKSAPASDVADDDNAFGGVPISEILMKKMAQKSKLTA